MYASHFGFHRQPFHSADACRAFFVSESIRTILPQLFHALRSDLGIAVLTGVPGSGKTSVLRHIQQQLSNEGRAIVCSGASLGTSAELITVLLQASRRKAGTDDVSRTLVQGNSSPETRADVLEQIRRTAELWGPVILLIDDAQLMPLPVLNELRACTEEEWNGRDLVRCLVSAPISFEEQLARSEYAEFGRRIRCHAFLQPLKSVESISFLQAQIELAGGRLSQVFATSALELISKAAGGIPRCLSLLADESLIVAMEKGEKSTTESSVRVALGRLQHLQYNWNASPDADIAEESVPESHPSFETTTSPDAVAARESDKSTGESSHWVSSSAKSDRQQTPTRATLAPGVIEFGGPAKKSNQDIQSSPPTPIVAEKKELSSERDTHTKSPSVVEFGVPEKVGDIDSSTQTTTPIKTPAAFEVGRRFFAESSSDSISIENIADCDIPDMLSQDNKPTFVDSDSSMSEIADRMDSVPADAVKADREISWIDGNASEPDVEPSVENDDKQNIGSISSIGAAFVSPPQTDSELRPIGNLVPWESTIPTPIHTSATAFVDSGDSRLSDCSPVFDRYTWIELGRKSPQDHDSEYSFTATMQQLLADYEFLSTNQLESLCKSTALATFATTIDQIPVARVVDSDLMDELRRNSLEVETGSFVALEPEHKHTDEVRNGTEPHELKLWHDGQLIFQRAADRESTDPPVLQCPASPTLPSAESVEVNAGGFFTLPVPIEKFDCDLRSLEIAEDRDVFPIVETLTSLRAEVRQFQQTGKTSECNLSTIGKNEVERPVVHTAESAAELDSLISRAKRLLDEQSAFGESNVVSLQMAPDVRIQREATLVAELDDNMDTDSSLTSTPKFSRLFTHLWENRRREAASVENDR